MIDAQDRIRLVESDSKMIWAFEMQTDHLISARGSDQVINHKNERTYRMEDFVVSVDHRVKIKLNEKRDKYLDLARELKQLLNMRVSMIPFVIGALETAIRSLERGMKNWKSV